MRILRIVGLLTAVVLSLSLSITGYAEGNDTTQTLVDIFIRKTVEKTKSEMNDFERAQKEFEEEKSKLQSDEIYNAFYDSAEAYQNAMKEEISLRVSEMMQENAQIVGKAEENILGDIQFLRTLRNEYEMNRSKIEYLLDSADRYVLLGRRELDVTRLQELKSQMESESTTETSQSESNYDLQESIILGSLSDLQFPVEGVTSISSRFGDRVDRATGTVLEFNPGLDFDASEGTAVYSLFNGRVTDVGYTAITGNYITISHGGGVNTVYTHLQSSSVGIGEAVTQYEEIGKVGSTGNIDGITFLHVGLYFGGVPMDLGVLFK